MTLFLTFVFLQACDVATTLLLLRHGGAEANPLVRAAMRVAPQPAVALVVLKAIACGLAWLACRSRRVRLLRKVNYLFAGIVAWNLVAIAAS
jgi:hypothetical protein